MVTEVIQSLLQAASTREPVSTLSYQIFRCIFYFNVKYVLTAMPKHHMSAKFLRNAHNRVDKEQMYQTRLEKAHRICRTSVCKENNIYWHYLCSDKFLLVTDG